MPVKCDLERLIMTYVVTDNCIQCRHTSCVDICPADAFHLGPNFIVINPEACVDCGLCLPECPEEAILPENRLGKVIGTSWR